MTVWPVHKVVTGERKRRGQRTSKTATTWIFGLCLCVHVCTHGCVCACFVYLGWSLLLAELSWGYGKKSHTTQRNKKQTPVSSYQGRNKNIGSMTAQLLSSYWEKCRLTSAVGIQVEAQMALHLLMLTTPLCTHLHDSQG